MITRYEPIEVVTPDGDDVAMEIRPDGEWVAHSDYEDIKAKMEEAKAEAIWEANARREDDAAHKAEIQEFKDAYAHDREIMAEQAAQLESYEARMEEMEAEIERLNREIQAMCDLSDTGAPEGPL